MTNIEKQRIEALNETTSPERLRELASSKDMFICENFCSNANTPIDILFQLGERFPKKFVNNPVFNLLVLEEPQFFNKIPP